MLAYSRPITPAPTTVSVRGGHVTPTASIHILQADGIRVHEGGFCRDQFDAIALELVADNVKLVLDDMACAIQQICHRDVLLDSIRGAVQAVLAVSREMQDRLPQRFAGDGTRIDTHAAENCLALDDRDALVEFCSLDRCALPRGPRTDHQ